MTDLSIIIVTYKGWSKLEKCLESVKSFSGSDFSFEAIIVDNSPDPGEIDPLKDKFPGFTYLHNPVNGGYANGTNLGSRKASGNFLLILNPDTVASAEAVSLLLKGARENGFTINSCRQVNSRGKESIMSGSFPEFRTLTGFMRAFSSRKKESGRRDILFPDWVSGSVILVSKDDFTRLNGFDEDFWMYYEDVDLCQRARDSGGEVAVFKDVIIEHNHGGSSRISTSVTSMTKTEVLISRHIYMCKHRKGLAGFLIQSFMVVNNLITNLITGIPGLLFFFVPKLFVRTLILGRLVSYYCGAAVKSTWVSPRSVNYRKYA
jgi:GT2 family glycosyltransferase